jgi:hypothetical protein
MASFRTADLLVVRRREAPAVGPASTATVHALAG